MVTNSSEPSPSLDRLSALLNRFSLSAHLIAATRLPFSRTYGDAGTAGHLHVLQSGELDVHHPAGTGLPARLSLREPTLLFYPAAVAHRLEPVMSPRLACAAVEFARGADHPLVRALPRFLAQPLADIDGLGPSLDLLFAEAGRVRCGHRLLADRLLEVVLIQVVRWLLDHPEQSGLAPGLAVGFSDPQIATALVAIHDAPGKPWTLEALAREATMSRSAFAERFRELVGQTPAAYVAEWRILLAQSRLEEGDTLASIAADLGYANQSGLSRAFSARAGVSPTAWLKAQQVATQAM